MRAQDYRHDRHVTESECQVVILEPGETKSMHYLDPSKEQELSIEVMTSDEGSHTCMHTPSSFPLSPSSFPLSPSLSLTSLSFPADSRL